MMVVKSLKCFFNLFSCTKLRVRLLVLYCDTVLYCIIILLVLHTWPVTYLIPVLYYLTL